VATVVLALVGAKGLSLLTGSGRRPRLRKPREEWQEAADALGLTLDPAADGRLIMAGEVRGYPIRVSVQGGRGVRPDDGGSANDEAVWTSYVLELPDWFPMSAELTAGTRLLQEGRLQTGDVAFDRRIKAFGPAERVLPLLDFDARKAMLAAADLGIDVTRREVRRRQPISERRSARLQATVNAMVAVAAGLDPQGRTAAAQLAKSVRRDPVAGARDRAIEALKEWHLHDPATRELADALAGSGLPARRELALPLVAPQRGIELAQGLVKDTAAEPEVRQRARQFLSRRGVELDATKGGGLTVAGEAPQEGGLSPARAEGALSKEPS